MVKLSYKTSEENIVSSAYATYKLKQGEGQLNLSQNNDINYEKPKNAVSCAIVLSTEGKLVTEVELELEYGESYADEESLSLLKQTQNGFEECDFTINKEENIIKTQTQGEGVWYLVENKDAER